MANHTQPNRSNHSLKDWLLPFIFLLFLPPVGMVMIFAKALGTDRKRKVDGQHPYGTAQQPPGARTGSHAAPSRATEESGLSALASKSKKLTSIGGGIALFCLFIVAACWGDSFHWVLDGEPMWFVEEMLEIIPFWCGLGGGIGAWFAGRRLKKKLQRCKQYLAMIGENKTIAISTLASATGRPARQIRDDLQDMLDDGCFPGGFLDHGGNRLILSSQGLRDEEPKPEAEKQTPKDDENVVLAEIRSINSQIKNKKLAAQVDRIGIITAKIFDYQKSNPDKAPELHSFLSYYLPTTMKILRAYAKLEDQGVQGENISAAMQRIETMMDKVVEGFEKQLDQLFHTDTLDITADVKVLEQMLAKDGLSSQDTLTLNL